MYEISAKASGGKIVVRNEQVLSVIEKHLVQAKIATTNGEMREQLVAIKALCDVLLINDIDSPINKSVHKSEVVQSINNPVQESGVVSSINNSVQGIGEVQSINKPIQVNGIVQPINNHVQFIPSQPVSSSSKLDEEDGANGDSIFDF